MFIVRHLTCEAAPTIRPLDVSIVHKTALERRTEELLADAIKNADWYTKPRRVGTSRFCPFEWKVSEPQYNRLPRHVVEAKCDNCESYCKPLVYHLSVRITESRKRYWTTMPVNVYWVYDPSRK